MALDEFLDVHFREGAPRPLGAVADDDVADRPSANVRSQRLLRAPQLRGDLGRREKRFHHRSIPSCWCPHIIANNISHHTAKGKRVRLIVRVGKVYWTKIDEAAAQVNDTLGEVLDVIVDVDKLILQTRYAPKPVTMVARRSRHDASGRCGGQCRQEARTDPAGPDWRERPLSPATDYTDGRLRDAAALGANPDLAVRRADVVVRDGIVHLWGVVPNDLMRRTCDAAVQRVPGVKQVMDHMHTAAGTRRR